MLFDLRRETVLYSLAIFFLGVLYFVWPIGGTIGIRNTLLFGLLFAFFIAYTKSTNKLDFKGLVPLTLFFIWSVLHSYLFAIESEVAVSNISSLTGRAFAAGVLGALAAIFLPTSFRVIAIIFLVPIALIASSGLYEIAINYIDRGVLVTRYYGMLENVDKLNYINHFAWCFLLAEVILRFKKRSFLKVNNAVLIFLLMVLLVLEITQNMRNGMITLVFLFVLMSMVLFKEITIKQKALLLAIVFISIAAIGDWAKDDVRWKTFAESVPLSLHTETYTAWLDGKDYPRLENGQPVNASNYLRIAWLKESSKMAIEYPMGLGLSKSPMGQAFQQYYGQGSGHSHSGVMDVLLSLGFVGLTLYILLFVALGRTAIMANSSFFKYALILLLADIFMRSILDSTVRDHMFEQSMFTLFFMAGMVGRVRTAKGERC
ncbi:O-antigen ligase family protein [Vibrio sp. LaRot3]|uniref:O-antigen ligase family protein n=1 Tax=Vibrio sp. LaRot3 TaxID=2998829 RepID=UPI0022CE0296|nr:O-antigen ligase family protein [Vibrio sp. LaRot3]MDA0149381.1 O-antigen ligase family protein [Vibrio sp. LaRot3]